MPKMHINMIESDPFISDVRTAINTHNMLHPGDNVLIGVSGGPDSMALLYALRCLAQEFSITIGIAHIDHMLRKEASDADAQFVASMAKKLELPFYMNKTDVRHFQIRKKLSLEDAGRQIRYRFFTKLLNHNNFQKLALGHHLDDNAESILMFLVRGSGLSGVSGIPPVRDRIIRPLIYENKSAILTFITRYSVPHVHDKTNADLNFTRNKIRHQLLPLITSHFNPNISETLRRFGNIMHEEDKCMEGMAESAIKTAVMSQTSNSLKLSVTTLKRSPSAILKRAVRIGIRQIKGDLNHISYSHLSSTLELLNKNADKQIDLPGKIQVKRTNDILEIIKQTRPLRTIGKEKEEVPFHYIVSECGLHLQRVHIKEIGKQIQFTILHQISMEDIQRKPHVAYIDMNSIHFPLIIRNAEHRDRFKPLGLAGSQKISNFFTNLKLPQMHRQKTPIVSDQVRILWVAGYRIDESVKIVGSTKRILKMELLLA